MHFLFKEKKITMQRILIQSFKVSRYRFWIYTAGTYVVGYALGLTTWTDFLRLEYFLSLIYFFFPGNVLLYGINDYYDSETDDLNPKKDMKEYRIRVSDKRRLQRILLAVIIISLGYLITLQTLTEKLIFATFLFLSYWYSAPPIRLKAVPFLDFVSNILYILPGILGYYQVIHTLPSLLIIMSGFFHTSAMHLFSAIPDIEYDNEANIQTTAVVLGKRRALQLCLFLWTFFAITVLYLTHFHTFALIAIFFPAIPLLLLINQDLDIEKIYWYLPYINTILGGLLFTYLSISNGF
jgi:4-hydroxybenzoate polyprenyltransferase